ncbi:hypothetical protein niasHS_007490 [Heterodera schachtii]|uniref:Ras modification protein ERF4 n=1 Tax=Heterodera schachtii TaxID=97005 RepID=A0ABD2JXM6_HETSC
MSSNNSNLLGKRKVALNERRKIYIQRDYSQALVVKFSTEFPEELEHYIDRDIWLNFVTDLNQIYAEAEKLTAIAYLENILGLVTCHLSMLCFKSLWKRKLEEAQALLYETNQQNFVRNGVYVCNPLEKGFRVIEVVLLDEPIPLPAVQDEKNEKNSVPKPIVLQPRQ